MFCSISGTVPENPVVSKKSGHLYEKGLVEKYVRETGKCPATGESLSLEDLMPLQANKTVKPRSNAATSIPGLLGLFRDEWDAVMLENHNLRQTLHQTRQELSHSLYQHDAATRVIARLIKERDEARSQLETVRHQVEREMAERAVAAAAAPKVEAPAAAPAEAAGIPDEVINELVEVNQVLSKGRKKRPISETLASPEQIEAYTLQGSHPLHKTTQGGIVALDINPDQQSIIASAGVDQTVQLFDYLQGRVLGALAGHSKKLTGCQYVSGEVLVTSSADKTTRIWRGGEGSYSCASVLRTHAAEVVGVSVHPSKRYFVTASTDATWAFCDVERASCMRQVQGSEAEPALEGNDGYTCISFHPDGLIVGTGTGKSASVRIWEVRQQKNVANFTGHTKPVRCLAFSENGYFLASAADDCVKLWDLRKLRNFKTIELSDDYPCQTVAWDHSGLYLAAGAADCRVFGVKQDWAIVKTFDEFPKRGVSALKWGHDARSLFVGSVDHNLRVFGLPQGMANGNGPEGQVPRFE